MPWSQLRDIFEENKQSIEEEQSKKPVSCPIDGTPLIENTKNILFCKFCGYKYQ